MKLILLLALSINLYAEDKKYTQKELDEKVKQRVAKEVKRLKKSSVAKLTQEILDKENALVKKEALLNKRLEQLELAEKSLDKKFVELEGIQKKVLGCIDENEKKESLRVSQLVNMISNMKPVKAADLLSVQDSDISIKIIEKIDPTKASKIFNLMDKEVSARLQKQYLNMRR
ncbi:MAG: hypothetical protein N4A33_07145 [Bacteriovoracaceae bacterium]|nr:hypothetical protein [Bacteriovoracaceae bacterium]